MTTNQVYEKILSTTPDDLEKGLVEILSHHKGEKNRISRRQLITTVGNILYTSHVKVPSVSTLDRQIRRAIEELQECNFPICSDSGSGGYWLAATYAEREAYIAEIESRANKLIEKARKLRSASTTIWNQPQEVSQPNLF